MRVHGVLIFALVLSQLSSAANAQLGGLFGRKKPAAEGEAPAEAKQGCADKPKKGGLGRAILGNMMNEVTGRVTGQMGMVGRWVPSATVAGLLSDAIACRLDPGEQKQAADATIAATRQEKVGATSTWSSSTRPGVSGKSTVLARSSEGGGSCMTVSDVVIVEGEETTVAKRMCRVPPATGYAIANA